MDAKYNEAKQKLEKYNQEHLLKFYEKLSKQEQDELVNDILSIDFEQLNTLYQNINKEIEQEEVVSPIEYVDKEKLSKEDKEKYLELGSQAIKEGKLAAVTMAGGQGTRLRT